MPVVYDRVQETSATLGTGTYTLAGAVAGYRTFAAACSTGDVVPYVAVDPATSDWEIGLGTYSAGTLARTTIRRSSNGNAAVSWASGTKQVFIDATAADALASLITSGIGAGTAGQRLVSGGSAANPSWADTDSSAIYAPGTTSITPPAWAKMVHIEVWGGGGGGGGGGRLDTGSVSQQGGAGGAGGGYSSAVYRIADLTAVLGTSAWPCAIGSGGAGGAGGTSGNFGVDGGAGGSTFFGSTVAAGALLVGWFGYGGGGGTFSGTSISGAAVATNGSTTGTAAMNQSGMFVAQSGSNCGSTGSASTLAAIGPRGAGGGGGAGAGFTAAGVVGTASAGGKPSNISSSGAAGTSGGAGGAGQSLNGAVGGGGGGGGSLSAASGTAGAGGAGATPGGGGGGGGCGRSGAAAGAGGNGGDGQIKVSYW